MVKSLLLVVLCLIYSFFHTRSLLSDIIDYLMNNSAVKKRKKGMTFKEWFTFSRFRTEIPQYHITIYYIIIALYIALIIFTIIIHSTNIISDFNLMRIGILSFTAIINGLYEVAFEGLHTRYTHIYRRDKIHLRGIDKKAYREKMKKINRKKDK